MGQSTVAINDPGLFGLVQLLILYSVTLLGLVVAVVGWGGARAGMIVGAVLGLAGVASMVYTLLSPWPRLWWASVVPIYAAWLAMAAWRSRVGTARRQPFRFGLRGLLTFVLVASVLVGGAAVHYQQEQSEQRIVARLDPRKVYVYSSAFGRISSVILYPENEPDLLAGIAALEHFRELRRLQVTNENILPGSTTRQIARLTSLCSLSVQNLAVTDADLEPLGKLWRLEELQLDASQLTDAGLLHLYPLKRLKKLYLYGRDPQRITPQGIQRLHAELPNLPPDYP